MPVRAQNATPPRITEARYRLIVVELVVCHYGDHIVILNVASMPPVICQMTLPPLPVRKLGSEFTDVISEFDVVLISKLFAKRAVQGDSVTPRLPPSEAAIGLMPRRKVVDYIGPGITRCRKVL